MRAIGIVCQPKVYVYKGVRFELGRMGPWPVKKDGTPHKNPSNKFWDTYEEWNKQPDKEDYFVAGGPIIMRGEHK